MVEYERMPKITSGLSVVLLALCVASCGEEDRVIKVTCGSIPNEAISADFGKANVGVINIGLMNTNQVAVGAILRLVPAISGDALGHVSVPYVLRVSADDFSPLKHHIATGGKVVSANLEIEVDADVEQSVKSLNIDLKSQIVNNTVLVTGVAQTDNLRDPVGVINADRSAVRTINTKTDGDRFVVVSGVSYGDEVDLFYAGQSIAVNTLEVGNLYLHIYYACSAVAIINSKARPSAGKVPILFFYVPVKYDDTSKTVKVDTSPIDLTQFNVDAAAM